MNSRFTLCLLLFLLPLFLPAVLAQTYPEPQGFVSDYAGIIDDGQQVTIEQLLSQLEKDTSVEIAVLTVDSLQGIDRETYAVEIFEKWGIGKKDINNGLLILVAPSEREYRFEVGYGLEGTISDGLAGRIGRNRFVDNFRAQNYGQGILEAVTDLDGLVRQDPSVVSQYSSSENTRRNTSGSFSFLYFIISFIFIGISSLTKKKSAKWGIRLGGGALFFYIFSLISLGAAVLFIFHYLFIVVAFSGKRGGGRGPILFGGFGGGFGGGSSGGFGGFGGGFSGGGGAGGGW